MKDRECDIVDFEVEKYRKLPTGARFVCMFSGGKDSGLALSMAMQQGTPVALVHILTDGLSLYHEQENAVIETQARALNLPLYYMHYKWWRNWDLAYKTLAEYRELGADSIVFGDIRLKYIFKGDIPLCLGAGFTPCVPVGGQSYDYLMDEIERRGLVSIITKINHPQIDRGWLGRPFNREAYEYFKQIGIDPFGELDEFHTTLVDADCYLHKLKYHLVKRDESSLKLVIDDLE